MMMSLVDNNNNNNLWMCNWLIECRMEREFSDYKKIGIHLNQFMGSSSSIGAKRVTSVCIAFRAATEQSNRPGCVPFHSPISFSILIFLLKFVHSFSQSNKSKEKKNTTCFSPRNPHCHPFPSFLLNTHTLYINLLQLILIIFSRSWFNNNTNRAC